MQLQAGYSDAALVGKHWICIRSVLLQLIGCGCPQRVQKNGIFDPGVQERRCCHRDVLDALGQAEAVATAEDAHVIDVLREDRVVLGHQLLALDTIECVAGTC